MTEVVSPVIGFNNNVRYRGMRFHIQTEDSGVARPHVITHLFADGGYVIKSIRTDYSEYVDHPDRPTIIQKLMREQHRGMALDLRDGRLDATIDKLTQSAAPSEAPDEPAPPEAAAASPVSVQPAAAPPPAAMSAAAMSAAAAASAASPSSPPPSVAVSPTRLPPSGAWAAVGAPAETPKGDPSEASAEHTRCGSCARYAEEAAAKPGAGTKARTPGAKTRPALGGDDDQVDRVHFWDGAPGVVGRCDLELRVALEKRATYTRAQVKVFGAGVLSSARSMV